MQAGYRRDPAESAKALKSKVKGKKRDAILYGAIIKQQSALSSIGNVPPPKPPATVIPPPSGFSNNISQINGGPTIDSVTTVAPTNTPIRNINPMGALDAKMLQERLSKLKKHDQTVTKSAIPTTKEKMESAMRDTKASLKPIDSRVPNVGINSNPSEMTASAAPTTASAAPTTASAKNSETEGLAKDLITRANEIQVRDGVSPSKQVTITAYAYDDSDTGARFTVKKETKKGNDTYRFQITPQSTAYGDKTMTKNDQGINIPGSILIALNKINDGSYNAKAATGELNGLGFSESDPTKIASSRVAWMSARAAGKNLPKGMIYVMAPSLLKGNLSIYNKSGRPIMSVSKISPAFQRIVRDTIDRNTFDPQDFSSIEPSESADVNHFISISKPIAPSGIDRLANADSIWKLKKRYEVLVGELSAGNDGLVVRQEMEAILRSLMRMHSINPAKAKDLIKALHDY